MSYELDHLIKYNFKNLFILTGYKHKLIDKFINKNQSNLTQKKATLIWTIKESVFKFHKKGNVNFKKDIVLDDFEEKNEGDLVIKFKRQKLNAYFFMIDNKYITYVCK